MRRIPKLQIWIFFCAAAFLGLNAIAHAKYTAKDALGTVLVGTVFGGAVGLSTVSFYSEPTKHWKNAVIGGGAGMLAGIGAAVFLVSSGSSENEIDPEELLPPSTKTPSDEKTKDQQPQNKTQGRFEIHWPRQPFFVASVLGQAIVLPKKDRVYALEILELRF